MHHQEFFLDAQHARPMPFGSGDGERVRRRAERRIVAVDLFSSGPATLRAVISDYFGLVDAFEGERDARVSRRTGQSVVRTAIEALCSEADSNERVGGPAEAAPQSA